MKIFPTCDARLLRTAGSAAIVCALALACGCVAKRGVSFGHWAMRGERINTIRVFIPENEQRLSGREKVLLFPPLGEMPAENLEQLQKHLHQEMLNYFMAPVYTLSRDGRMREYISEDNLLLAGGMFNTEEAGRIGKMLGATHSLCVLVRQFRPYPPQVLALSLVMVDNETCRMVAEMDATFDAAQQEVLIAADEYLQTRLAREYSSQNLDILLRSPTQYSGFVSCYCCRVLAQVMQRHDADLRNQKDEPIEKTERSGPT
jgi:hypothetical protein